MELKCLVKLNIYPLALILILTCIVIDWIKMTLY